MRLRELHRSVASALLVLMMLAVNLVGTAKSEEPISSEPDLNRNVSLDSEFKSQASDDETSSEHQRWSFHVQATEMLLGQQFVANPAYNSDRGPINIFAARVHFQF